MMTEAEIWPQAAGRGATANVEFVSATPTGPLGFQDIFAGVTGDALARVMARCGWQTTREFYVNDAGAPVNNLARAVHALIYRLAANEAPPDDLSPYMAELGAHLMSRGARDLVMQPEVAWLPALRSQTVEFTLGHVREVFARHGIRIDNYTHESVLTANRRPEDLLRELGERGLLREIPEANTLLPRIDLATSRFGDTEDHPLRTADGTWTYFMGDVLYHADKLARGYDVLVNVFRADHAAYGERILATVAALSGDRQVRVRLSLLDPVAPELHGPLGDEVLAYYPPRVLRWLLLTRKTGDTVTLGLDDRVRSAAEVDLSLLDAVLHADTAPAQAGIVVPLDPLVAEWTDRVAETLGDLDVTRLGRFLRDLAHALAAAPESEVSTSGRRIAVALAGALGLD